MKKTLGCLLAVASSLALNAGTAKFIGRGVSEVAPEFVEISVTITSQCYSSPLAANTANNQVAGEIQTYLKTKMIAESKIDDVATQGGYSEEDTRSAYENGQSRPLCPGAYRSETTIRFRTILDTISERYADIQTSLYAKFQKNGDDAKSPVTFVQISRPWARVCSETTNQMELDALDRSAIHAYQQFDVIAKRCNIQGKVEIASSDTPTSGFSTRINASYARESAGDSPAVNLSFDNLRTGVEREYTFTYPETFFVCGQE